MKANVDWQDFRERQRDTATETVKSTLVIDEIARREAIEATDEDLGAGDREVRRARRPDAGGGSCAAREGGRARSDPRGHPAREDDGVAHRTGECGPVIGSLDCLIADPLIADTILGYD